MADETDVLGSLPPDVAEAVRDAVGAGEYASGADVIRAAVAAWALGRSDFGISAEELGRLWDEGIASGPAPEGELEAMIADARRNLQS